MARAKGHPIMEALSDRVDPFIQKYFLNKGDREKAADGLAWSLIARIGYEDLPAKGSQPYNSFVNEVVSLRRSSPQKYQELVASPQFNRNAPYEMMLDVQAETPRSTILMERARVFSRDLMKKTTRATKGRVESTINELTRIDRGDKLRDLQEVSGYRSRNEIIDMEQLQDAYEKDDWAKFDKVYRGAKKPRRVSFIPKAQASGSRRSRSLIKTLGRRTPRTKFRTPSSFRR